MTNIHSPFTIAMIVVSLSSVGGCSADEDDNRLVGQLASDRIELTAEVSEAIIERPVAEGQTVDADQVIIRQDTRRIEARMREANAMLEQTRARHDELVRGPRRELILAAQANLRGAQKELEFREAELVRADEVYERNLGSQEVRDAALVARDLALANVESFEAKLSELLTGSTAEELRQVVAAVDQAEARYQSTRIDLERHLAKAPTEAIVDSLLFEVGERPAVGQPMAILLAGEQVYARIYIPESLRVRVKPGTAARVYVDGLSDSLTGRVRWVASESSFTPYFALTERDRGRLSYVAKIDIVDASERLADGVPVEVELLLDNRVE